MKLRNMYLARFHTKYCVDEVTDCWNWRGNLSQDGYGQFHYNGATTVAHRFIYECTHGAIPGNMTVHHQCNNRACVNLNHLELLSKRDNVLLNGGLTAINAAKTHCIRGHAFDDKNTYVNPTGARECKACRRIRKRKSQKKYLNQ